jgi:predicted transcriptional regulator
MECAANPVNIDKFLILPIAEGSRTVTEVLSKEGSFKILEVLSEDLLSVREISRKTGLPFVDVEDKIMALMESDLVERKSRSSGMGDEDDIYGPSNRFVVFSSEDNTNVV